jgi:putative membrane protein
MLQKLLIKWAILTIAVWLAAAIVPGVDVHGGFFTIAWVALLFGLVNAVLGPFLRLLALPFTLLTLGLFALVVNGLMLWLTSSLSETLGLGFYVRGFWAAFWGALVVSLVSLVLSMLIRDQSTSDRY